jgi:hypothetical protein
LYVDTYKGVREVDHSGATAGYRAHLGRYPEQGVSVAVLCNVGSAAATNYAKAVAELLLTDLREGAAPAATHTLTSEEGARLAGMYTLAKPATVARVSSDQKGLRVQGVGELVPSSATRFTAADRRVFEFDGRRLRVTDEFGTADLFDRVEPAAPSDEQLRQYLGRYVSDEIETTLTVEMDAGKLVLKRRPDTTFALTPVYPDGFFCELGAIIFRRDASGRIVSLSVNQDRVWDLTFERTLTRTTAPTRAPR